MSLGAELPMDIRALKLRPGMFLQALPDADGSAGCELQFAAIIGGKGIMVVPITDTVETPSLIFGQIRRFRGFTGLFDFSFSTEVLQSFEQPFVYTLLAYPKDVLARRVRNSPRIPTALPAYVRRSNTPAPLPSVIVDLSVAGAMVASSESIGSNGEVLRLSFSVLVDGRPADLILEASICHSTALENKEGIRTGLAFKNLSRNDSLLLSYYALAQSSAVN